MTLKIAVYTIALSEEAHCERWAASVADADYRIVLDTGSTDNTVDKLKSLGVTVYQQKFAPWRFDTARNAALSLVPLDADVCISMDMDEFMAPGYREKIEQVWSKETTRLAYTYVFDYHPNGSNQGFYSDKIHARLGYEWRRPVHETVYAQDGIQEIIASDLNIAMNQIQDRSKTTRNNYLPLLKVAYEEAPNDSQIAFWYGRELVSNGDNELAIPVFKNYLALPTSCWDAERSESLIHLSKLENTKTWDYLLQAASTAPSRREVWLEIANYCYPRQDWINLMWACLNGLDKSKNQGSYLDRAESWGSQLADLGSIAAFHLGWNTKAVDLVRDAITLSPNDHRLGQNLGFMLKARDSRV